MGMYGLQGGMRVAGDTDSGDWMWMVRNGFGSGVYVAASSEQDDTIKSMPADTQKSRKKYSDVLCREGFIVLFIGCCV